MGEIGALGSVEDLAGGGDDEAGASGVEAVGHGGTQVSALGPDAREKDREVWALLADLPELVWVGCTDDEADVAGDIPVIAPSGDFHEERPLLTIVSGDGQ